MAKSIYSLKEERLKKYCEKFNNQKPRDNNGGNRERPSSNKYSSKR